MSTVSNYSCDKLDIDVYSEYLSAPEAKELFRKIMENPIHIKHTYTKSGVPSKKRNKTIYGSLERYKYMYRGKSVETPIIHWDKFPELRTLAEKIGVTTGQSYNTCVIQIYNSGVVGIKPHRDKEMLPKTNIASISLGETRVMRFERHGFEAFNLPLDSGSLCVLKPPTNDYWLHSIPTDDTKNCRISLVFRNF
jgi:alkylated DNA repair dioxygenase AlkB